MTPGTSSPTTRQRTIDIREMHDVPQPVLPRSAPRPRPADVLPRPAPVTESTFIVAGDCPTCRRTDAPVLVADGVPQMASHDGCSGVGLRPVGGPTRCIVCGENRPGYRGEHTIPGRTERCPGSPKRRQSRGNDAAPTYDTPARGDFERPPPATGSGRIDPRTSPGDPGWFPGRPADVPEPTSAPPLPSDTAGQRLSAPHRTATHQSGAHSMASVAEVKQGIDAALAQVEEAQGALNAAREKITAAVAMLYAVSDGTGHETIQAAAAALVQMGQSIDEAQGSGLAAAEHAQTYMHVL